MGGHNTHISNKFDVPVRVKVTHPSGKIEDIRVEPSQSYRIPTAKGLVTVCAYNPGKANETPADIMTIPSNISVLLKRDKDGNVKICKVLYKYLWDEDSGDEPER